MLDHVLTMEMLQRNLPDHASELCQVLYLRRLCNDPIVHGATILSFGVRLGNANAGSRLVSAAYYQQTRTMTANTFEDQERQVLPEALYP